MFVESYPHQHEDYAPEVRPEPRRHLRLVKEVGGTAIDIDAERNIGRLPAPYAPPNEIEEVRQLDISSTTMTSAHVFEQWLFSIPSVEPQPKTRVIEASSPSNPSDLLFVSPISPFVKPK